MLEAEESPYATVSICFGIAGNSMRPIKIHISCEEDFVVVIKVVDVALEAHNDDAILSGSSRVHPK